MKVDVAIVGAGLGGLSVALSLADRHRVVILAKRAANECASDYAQGGIAAVLDPGDSVDAHVDDTLIAGAGLCDTAAVRTIVERGRRSIDWLIEQGSAFTPDADAAYGYHLTREGGHRHRRIVHAADATGHAVLSALAERVRLHPNITVLDEHLVVGIRVAMHADEAGEATDGRADDSVVDRDATRAPSEAGADRRGDDDQHHPTRRCTGLDVLDVRTGARFDIEAGSTVLATGGAGQVYPHTSNPATSTGDGIAMAWRAGCRIANMEFVQFHPTCLFHPDAKSFLISEAVRGEGGLLKLPNGHRFMPDHDARAELAPRDIVARAIDIELKRHQIDCVYLDISHQPPAFLREHFPTILARCAEFGIDITRDPIPVVPAAHYTCGGIVTDTDGRTDLPDLYAVGEAAYTGLHGANRLASNSLLECVVLGRAAADAMSSTLVARHERVTQRRMRDVSQPHEKGGSSAVVSRSTSISTSASAFAAASTSTPATALAVAAAAAAVAARDRMLLDCAAVAACRRELQQLMWRYVGIVRTEQGLAEASQRIAALRARMPARDAAGWAPTQKRTSANGRADAAQRHPANASTGHSVAAIAPTRASGGEHADRLDGAAQIWRDLLELDNLLDTAALIVDSARQRRESRGAHYRADWPSRFAKALPTTAVPPLPAIPSVPPVR